MNVHIPIWGKPTFAKQTTDSTCTSSPHHLGTAWEPVWRSVKRAHALRLHAAREIQHTRDAIHDEYGLSVISESLGRLGQPN